MAEQPVTTAAESVATATDVLVDTPAPRRERRTSGRFTYDRTATWPRRVLAATSHLAIVLSLPGLLYAGLLWAVLRRRIPYVAAHARQAFRWQILTNVALLLMIGVIFLAAYFSLGGTLNLNASATASGTLNLLGLFGSLLALWIVLIVGAVVAIGTALIGALVALVGRSFYYPFVNRRRKSD